MIEKLADDLRPEKYTSLVQVFEFIVNEHSELPAFSCYSRTLSYAEVDDLSNRFAHYLQNHTALNPGDRIAIQLPNVLQFPVAFYGAEKAGLIVVNTNPLYTPTEMCHQFRDSGVKAIVILASFCAKLEEVIADTSIETVIVTQLGDLQKPLRRLLLNFGAKYIKKVVPEYHLPGSVGFKLAVRSPANYSKDVNRGAADDVALILYTGGTTGSAKGAMLSHRNLIANMMQLRCRCLLVIEDKIESIVAPLPLYHSYAFLLHCLVLPYGGNHNILVTNPGDSDGLVEILKKTPFTGFVGINTLYLALLNHNKITSVDFRKLKFCGAGGMAMTTSVAKQWKQLTGCEVIEGYGLTECSPVVSVNIPGKVKLGTVGPLVPETEIRIVDDAGRDVTAGEKGELWVRGPQVMCGYWQQPQATAETITDDGWLKTGDYAQLDEDNYLSIVDRKKDMILVSGFNVFPNEIEDWVCSHPQVLECAAIGVANERSGESVKLFVVCKDGDTDQEELIKHCKKGLAAYKIPKEVVFVAELQKSNIGKILRRELRE
jgi:long-chain acyl-CoA synthetase